MSKRAEEQALEVYPSTEKEWKSEFGTFRFDDTNIEHREGFIVGYNQAEKDIYKEMLDTYNRIREKQELSVDYGISIEESKLPIDELLYQKGYEQAEKDLAQDFHADTLIGDKDYAVFHADVEELNGDLYNYCQEQGFTGKVKVIIVEND